MPKALNWADPMAELMGPRLAERSVVHWAERKGYWSVPETVASSEALLVSHLADL